MNGCVYAVAADGSGGFYIGGSFTSVDGVARSRLARITSTGALDLAFAPAADNVVTSLAVRGSAVYVNGAFTTIDGQTRNRIAALDADTGLATPWNPNAGSSYVRALALSGGTLYVGGDFTTIGGLPRRGFAVFEP